METMQELIPFAKEMLSQKPSRKLLKLYLLGSVFAVLGTAIGLVETLCQPFSSGEPMDAEMLLMLNSEHVKAEAQPSRGIELQKQEEQEEEQEEELVQETKTKTENLSPSKTYRLIQRSSANRLHAS
ncbi:G0/G1 switch protein 2 [Cyprinodon tularosa]|uniref:G0/G1 switch protein 2 n=1 Tax=Cyprinodon tularosa TaxID=77115 RepID=UPI0018E246BC|nr:G0/G1 switch protein 2 [Cyprinodon tularosa]